MHFTFKQALINQNNRTVNPHPKLTVLNPLMPVKIIDAKWSNCGEPDIIRYCARSGGRYIIQSENLLRDICGFMDANGFKSPLPHVHVQNGKGWECYPRPENIHILEFLWAYKHNYDIYSIEGVPVREANRKFS